jgi:predicted subunit of tRNA(5-methylaminomethyl-2-thiouridylate) methyltransferase
MNNEAKRIALMFSGGVDSTMAALRLAERYDGVDLVTYHNGYGHYKMMRTARRANQLAKRHPNVFTHNILSIQNDFERFVLSSLEQDYDDHGSGFVWCLGCKLVMHMRTVLFCLEKGITMAADGSSGDTAEMVEQMPASVQRIRRFYQEYGIGYETPVYEAKRADSITELKRLGYKLGIPIGDRFLGSQPKCKPGELYYMPYLLLGIEPDHQEARVTGYIDAKLKAARANVTDFCTRRGIALPDPEASQ